ncbi:unnamed protein product [marine sediment metagenome]|uniref:Uncharacterized protein n=1 Tax=marine sediment metagenome TaxID=412755 RepID=X1CU94_9ZZZZ
MFCMNPDHYHVDWAAAKTFDGTRKDPLHYDPDHKVEPEFKQMWAKLGYDVNSDIDILAAKFDQLYRIMPDVMFQMMNEDDGFGLFNEADQKLFNTKFGYSTSCTFSTTISSGKLNELLRRISFDDAPIRTS